MPLYEYQCQACQHQHVSLQQMSDPPLTVCPNCHEAKLKKIISSTGFQLKGGGWYVTDFKNKSDAGKASEGSKKSDGKGSSE